MVNVAGKRECNVSSVGIIEGKSNGVTSGVENFSKVADHIANEIPESLWERLDKFDLVNFPTRFLRIGFDNLTQLCVSSEYEVSIFAFYSP